MNRPMFASVLSLAVLFVCGSGVSIGQDDKATEEKAPLFVRVKESDAGTPQALECAVVSYKIASGPYAGAVIDLIGAVHIGEQSYYQRLNSMFKSYEVILYELVAESTDRPQKNEKRRRGGANPVSSLQTGMKDALKLAFQLEEIDYRAKNFVHADMNPSEFSEDMTKRNDGVISMMARLMGAGFALQGSKKANDNQAEMTAAMLSRDPLRMRRAMAKQFESLDNQMVGIADKDGKSTLLTERNAKAFSVLEEQLKAGKRKLGVFYGAGHFPDMHKRLLKDFGAVLVETDWVEAWNLRSDAIK
ncbi:MAG: hypothetical protein ACKO3V_00970 [Pirellula sp.]|jgi:hypothetical protein